MKRKFQQIPLLLACVDESRFACSALMKSLRLLACWVLPLAMTLFSGCGSKEDSASGSSSKNKDILYAGVLDKADSVTVLKLDDLLKSPIATHLADTPLFQMLGEQINAAQAEQGDVEVGIKDVKRVLISNAVPPEALSDPEAMTGDGDMRLLVAVEFSKEIDVKKAIDAAGIDADGLEGPTEMGNGQLFTSDETIGADRKMAMGVVSANGGTVAFIGTQPDVEGALKSGPVAMPEAFAACLDSVPDNASFYALYNGNEELKQSLQKEAEGDPMAGVLATTQQATFSMVTEADIDLKIALTMSDAEKAKEGKEQIDSALAPMLEASEPASPMVPAMTEFKKSVATSVDGEVVMVTAKLTQGEIDKLSNAAAMVVPMLMMQFQGQQGGPGGMPTQPVQPGQPGQPGGE